VMPMEIESASAMAMKVVSRAERRIARDYYGFEIGAAIGGRLRSGRSTSQTAPLKNTRVRHPTASMR
jgi:hypothetical protein